ncbi:MAG: hypothetical protein PW734_04115 [Verrucomicrobium sp.]|nr:hypothetical protein [Verrucomicrobium sp.]
MSLDLKKSFDETTGFIHDSKVHDVDLAALGRNLDVPALAAAKPEEISVPPYFGYRQGYYAAALAALAYMKGSLSQADGASRAELETLSKAGANVAASFFRFAKEPVYLHPEPGEARQTAPVVTAALFETMRSVLTANIGDELKVPCSVRTGETRYLENEAAVRATPWFRACHAALAEFEAAGRSREGLAEKLQPSKVVAALQEVAAGFRPARPVPAPGTAEAVDAAVSVGGVL